MQIIFAIFVIMNISDKGINLIIKWETGNNISKYTTAYQDVRGVWTIGIGTTYYLDGSRVKKGDKLTEKDAINLFKKQIVNYENDVKRLVKKPLNQNQFDALVSFTYNLGATNLSKSTLLRKINANPNDPSIPREFMKWVYAGGKRFQGLVNRRREEADLWKSMK